MRNPLRCIVAPSLMADLALALSVNAGEPLVQEKTLPDGLTELRVVSDAGKDLAVYKVDLKTHPKPPYPTI